MKREIEIGRAVDTGRPVMLDVDITLRSGLIVQANSGGGKSWLLRRLAEQLCPLVPTFVVDVEGEFASLREKFPFFLVAKQGGDTPADPRSAGAVARKLLELRVSAVFDLFELDIPDRHAWVRGFLHGIDTAPRDLWGDTAILIDEAHVFAPEKGKGESVALGGMAALASRGRKRGYGPIDATQRIGKFNKDVAAELKNAAVGLAWLDIDRDRAIEALGVGRKERESYDRQLRSMEPGQFFVVGRAFGGMDPVKVKIGPVESTHPEPGSTKQVAAPPPPAKIRSILAKLGDLPTDEPSADGAATPGAAGKMAALERELAELRARPPERVQVFPREVVEKLRVVEKEAGDLTAHLRDLVQMGVLMSDGHDGQLVAAVDGGRWPARPAAQPTHGVHHQPPANDTGDGAMRMLRALAARHPTPLTEQQVAVLAGMARKGGTYRTYRGKLTGAGLVVKDGDFLRITADGLRAAGPVERPTSPAELLAVWRERFQGKAKDLLEFLAANGSRPIPKADALKQIGLDPAGGTARTYWGQLSGCGLIEKTTGGFRAVESLRLVA